MDKKLLEALNNLSIGLSMLAEVIEDKKDPKTTTAKALQSANIVDTIKSIDVGVKSIQKDTKEILKNQQTLIELSKGGNRNEILDNTNDPKRKQNLKDGVSIILLMASGILAIGLAFKIIGDVNFASVVALSVSLPLIAMAFEKISQIKGLTISDMGNLVLITIAMSVSIMMSSIFLSGVVPVSPLKLLTSIGIAAAFGLISFSIGKLVKDISGIGPMAVAGAAIMPVVLVATSLAIMGSSHILSEVKPVGISQMFTTILIATTFTVLSYGMSSLMKGIKGVNPVDVLMLPIVLIALSIAIVESSYILKDVQEITLSQSLNILLLSITLSVSSAIMGLSIFALSKLGINPAKAIMGSLSIVIIAGAIALSSLLISKGQYSLYPDLNWSIGVGISLLTFGIATVGLGLLITSTGGMGSVAILAGAVAIPVIAASIVASSHILNTGDYSSYPPIGWAISTSLVLGTFGIAAVTIGSFVLGTLGIGGLAIKAGINSISLISQSIADSSHILSSGTYQGGPNKEWAEGVSLAISSFAPVFTSISKNSGWLRSKVSPTEMVDAIKTISSGIVGVADYFGKNQQVFDPSKVPSKNWAEGISLAISSFAPVFDIVNNSKFANLAIGNLLRGIYGIANSIVNTSVIISEGRFEKLIPDNFLVSLSKNLKEYVNLLSWLDENKVSTGPMTINRYTNGILQVAKSYDVLSDSLGKLTNSIDSINLNKLDVLKSFTGTIVLMSMMDTTQFESMMDTLDRKAKIFVDIINDATAKTENRMMSQVNLSSFDNKNKVTNEDLLRVLNSIDFRLSTISLDTKSLSNYIKTVDNKPKISNKK